MQKFVPQRRFGIFCNERTRSIPLDPKLMFWCISYYLGAFGTVWLPYEKGAKRAELVQKFVHEVASDFFHNERTRSTPLDPKLTFWFVSYYLGAFRTVCLPNESRCKTGRTSVKVRAIFCNERTKSTPLNAKLTFWCVSYYSGAFGTIWLPYGTR